jgi:transcriptional regulator with XRE-family HTH domain
MELSVVEQIKIICGRKGLTVSDLARKMGITPQGLWQTLKKDNMSLNVLYRIADALDCEVNIEIKEKVEG